MSRSPSRYVHGSSPEEQRRLDTMNGLLNESSVRELGLAGGERIIDFGSGLGQLTRAMVRAAGPGGSAVGIERSKEQLDAARRLYQEAGDKARVDFRQGDVTDPPLQPDEWGGFDVAHARFVLEHVPDPLDVVRVMLRAVRPCGRVVLEDEDHDIFRFWPEPPGIEAVWRAYVETYPRAGNDPYVGRKLVALLHEAGAKPKRTTLIFFGGSSGMVMFPDLIENLAVVLEGAREAIVAGGRIGEKEFGTTMDELRRWGKRPDAAIWFAMAWAEGVKPG